MEITNKLFLWDLKVIHKRLSEIPFKLNLKYLLFTKTLAAKMLAILIYSKGTRSEKQMVDLYLRSFEFARGGSNGHNYDMVKNWKFALAITFFFSRLCIAETVVSTTDIYERIDGKVRGKIIQDLRLRSSGKMDKVTIVNDTNGQQTVVRIEIPQLHEWEFLHCESAEDAQKVADLLSKGWIKELKLSGLKGWNAAYPAGGFHYPAKTAQFLFDSEKFPGYSSLLPFSMAMESYVRLKEQEAKSPSLPEKKSPKKTH